MPSEQGARLKYGSKEYMQLLYAEARPDGEDGDPAEWLEQIVGWYDSMGYDGRNLVMVEPHEIAQQVVAITVAEALGDDLAMLDVTAMISSAFSMGLETGIRLGKARWDV